MKKERGQKWFMLISLHLSYCEENIIKSLNASYKRDSQLYTKRCCTSIQSMYSICSKRQFTERGGTDFSDIFVVNSLK
jgi:hypothetical protein